MNIGYDLDRIKYGIDEKSWERAVGLYQSGKVKDFKDDIYTFVALVQGTQAYEVFVSKRSYSVGDCTCYLGRNDTLCKHMIAVAIYGLKNGKKLTKDESKQHNDLQFSGKVGELTQDELRLCRKEISGAMRYIKAYVGPSKTWFAYQDSLVEGCNRLAGVISQLPVSRQTSDLVVRTMLRLDKKLQTGGVDDSDGTVGGFIQECVVLLTEFVKVEPECKKSFDALKNIDTCFEWEEDLLGLVEGQ